MQDLKELLKKWRTAQKAGDSGPLAIAQEIIAVGETWVRYKDQAGGVTFSTWLRENGLQPPGYYRSRAPSSGNGYSKCFVQCGKMPARAIEARNT